MPSGQETDQAFSPAHRARTGRLSVTDQLHKNRLSKFIHIHKIEMTTDKLDQTDQFNRLLRIHTKIRQYKILLTYTDNSCNYISSLKTIHTRRGKTNDSIKSKSSSTLYCSTQRIYQTSIAYLQICNQMYFYSILSIASINPLNILITSFKFNVYLSSFK